MPVLDNHVVRTVAVVLLMVARTAHLDAEMQAVNVEPTASVSQANVNVR